MFTLSRFYPARLLLDSISDIFDESLNEGLPCSLRDIVDKPVVMTPELTLISLSGGHKDLGIQFHSGWNGKRKP